VEKISEEKTGNIEVLGGHWMVIYRFARKKDIRQTETPTDTQTSQQKAPS
jgi:hypothetical protein